MMLDAKVYNEKTLRTEGFGFVRLEAVAEVPAYRKAVYDFLSTLDLTGCGRSFQLFMLRLKSQIPAFSEIPHYTRPTEFVIDYNNIEVDHRQVHLAMRTCLGGGKSAELKMRKIVETSRYLDRVSSLTLSSAMHEAPGKFFEPFFALLLMANKDAVAMTAFGTSSSLTKQLSVFTNNFQGITSSANLPCWGIPLPELRAAWETLRQALPRLVPLSAAELQLLDSLTLPDGVKSFLKHSWT